MEGFQGTTFEPEFGEIYGIRVWRMDNAGKLRARAISTAAPWEPGVNQASCYSHGGLIPANWLVDPSGRGRQAVTVESGVELHVPDDRVAPAVAAGLVRLEKVIAGTRLVVRHRVVWDTGESSYLEDDQLVFDVKPSHAPPHERCGCGFYAYLDPDDEQAAASIASYYVVGIIKGYGRTLIGTKGFRCEKAEIMAVLDPRAAPSAYFQGSDWVREAYESLRTNYPDVVILPTRKELIEFAPLGQIMDESGA